MEKLVEKIISIRDKKMNDLEKLSEELDKDDVKNNFAKKDILDIDFYKTVGEIKGLNEVLKLLMEVNSNE